MHPQARRSPMASPLTVRLVEELEAALDRERPGRELRIRDPRGFWEELR